MAFLRIIGVDEAGRGPLAGPVVAACVILDQNRPVAGLDDSKKLMPSVREQLYQEIFQNHRVGVGVIEPQVIDKINILQATFLAMRKALDELSVTQNDLVMIDGQFIIPKMPGFLRQQAVIGGDGLVEPIMAASIIAKVYRDHLMIKEDAQYPLYGFSRHKGYGTPEHLQAINDYGPCPIHRLSFRPLRDDDERKLANSGQSL